ncbi:MAG TPA: beta-N-acetylglucosaminidase [Maribacter sp.]|uniref:glycoside hydrolase family 3 N-terminal domain-containing protein n=1 Tax=unclassified Maribacter TaxID=2615042 RepID=UPI000ECAD7A1|nr:MULTISPECIES: glycoside hydrolase family 3 N-terminal domain-containing protein [unclassified Maribacter]HAF78353.1 beta-N-acetylglucosaminidase [Maribacter sp.]|tara:strand:+ start:142052 stop:144961 length:2910 start_codon:yes stop_codon:yes gene_type:complete
MRHIFIIICGLFCYSVLSAQNPLVTSDSLGQQAWVNSQYAQMSLDEKLGQLFMVSVASNQSKQATDKIKNLIVQEHLGGVIFSKGGPVRQAKLTNNYQAVSKIPLLIGMDAEWGLSMRLDSTYAFPWNMTLGAIQDSSIVERVGYQIGKHAKRLGVHINFAPDLDINTNPKNPIIGNRSFGENRDNVVQKGIAFIKGMERAGVLANGKHFPGHGDTEVDSHHNLPIIPFSRKRLDSLELYPFKKIIGSGLSSIMVAHLEVPALEMKKELPSSISEQIITGILKEELGYNGLIFTDALNMKGVSTTGKEGSVELAAFMAGNDMLLMPENIVSAKEKLTKAYEKGKLTEDRLAYSVKKILMAKYKAGLHHYKPIKLENLYNDLNGLEDDIVYEQAIENAITVVKNKLDLLSIKNLDNKKIAYVKMGNSDNEAFVQGLKNYAEVTVIEASDITTLKTRLKEFNLIIVGHHMNNESPWKSYKFSNSELEWLQEIANERTSNLILCVFAKPYALSDIDSFNNIDAVVMAYQNSDIAQEKTAEILFGAVGATGKLPVTAHEEFPVHTGVEVKSLSRLGYSIPERVGMSSQGLKRIDELMHDGLDSLMFPGAQVLVARKGKVIYQKGFGKPTYDSKENITNDYIYDLASLTKILATLPMVMKMEEEGRIGLNNTFEELVPNYSNTEIKNVTVLKALSHYGRLPAWIPFYIRTLDDNKKPSSEFYRNSPLPGFSTKVYDNLYLTDAYQDSIYNRIGRQDLKSNRYRYSDVPYYVMKKVIEDSYGQRLDHLSNKFLYQRIGANHTTYNPLEKFDKNSIVPSEEDDYYRYGTVQGYVHDMGAAMQAGVGGHAGLFSNANDIAKIMQMYLQDGYYGGTKFFDSRTVKKFNTCYFCENNVRRGVGFDKPQLQHSGPTCGCVSRKSFGHSGFTGTYTWADPEEEIVYVFLSNRTYPSASNTLLVKSGLRTRIQQAIYDSILN